jgi:3-phosphoshikimate 1-carboxyvinyltransferase
MIQLHPLLGPADCVVEIPGSKSYTNRALFMAALTEGTVRIVNPLISDDTEAMMHCLESLGIACTRSDKVIEVSGGISRIREERFDLNANLSGTTIRFLLPLLCAIPGTKTLRGEEGLNKRPIKDLVEGLRQLGADIDYIEKEGCPPLKISSNHLNAGVIRMNGGVSSQYFSAILMAAPLLGGVTIEVVGDQISKPYIDMTIDTMQKFGVAVENEGYKRYQVVGGQSYQISEYIVEGDVSSASYFAAIATITKSRIVMKNMNPQSVQADMGFLKILEQMGSKIEYDANDITVTGSGVRAMDVDMENCPDQAQTLAVLAAFADGVTTISGVRSLRVKETERVKAVEAEFSKMGIKTESTEDVLKIYGGSPKSAAIDTYGDHRMAMSFAVAGAVLRGMQINNPEVVSKTFPEFWEKLSAIGIVSEGDILRSPKESSLGSRNIVLIGMRGSGKTTTAKALAQKMGVTFVETDALIVAKEGKSIVEIVAEKGWGHFRDLETDAVREVSRGDNQVISTGGGVILHQENIELLEKNGTFVYLRSNLETLRSRIAGGKGRPSLTGAASAVDEIEEILLKRSPVYESIAEIVVDTDGLAPAQVADTVLEKLRT